LQDEGRCVGGYDRIMDEADYRSMLKYVSELSDTVVEQALRLKKENGDLERRVRERTAELERANLDAMYMLATAAEAHDHETGEHVRRVELMSYRLARALGVDETEARQLGQASVLHDVGKLFLPLELLTRPGPLNEEERARVQLHTVEGERLIADRPYFILARRIARNHHENVDGSGYPDGLAGEVIPLEARIVRIVDAADALLSARPYKPAWPREKVAEYLKRCGGTLFDARLVPAYLALSEKTPPSSHDTDWMI
jgi:putative two-component system response regulator